MAFSSSRILTATLITDVIHSCPQCKGTILLKSTHHSVSFIIYDINNYFYSRHSAQFIPLTFNFCTPQTLIIFHYDRHFNFTVLILNVVLYTVQPEFHLHILCPLLCVLTLGQYMYMCYLLYLGVYIDTG